jgi:endonuclease/exonuclease/phosphatase family metal-dependent hydrolase
MLMKVLSFNVGYFLGFQSQREWLRRPHRLFIGNRTSERARIGMLIDLLEEENPDAFALQEVDRGSIRSSFIDQHRVIVDRLQEAGLDYEHRADTKYGESTITTRIPVLRNMSNSIFWSSGTGAGRYLSNGTKRLVHMVSSENAPTVLSVHLSKTSGTRAEQLKELAQMVDNHEEVLLMGDFNVKDTDEFHPLTEGADLDLYVPGKSFSTAYPTYAFDVFLTSCGLSVERCEVLTDMRFSDHMPVVAEIQHD